MPQTITNPPVDYLSRIDAERSRLLEAKKSLLDQLAGVENQLFVLSRLTNPDPEPEPAPTPPSDTPTGSI